MKSFEKCKRYCAFCLEKKAEKKNKKTDKADSFGQETLYYALMPAY